MRTQCINRDSLNDLVRECECEQPPRRPNIDAARTEIKDLLVIELADAGPVRAFHVVCVNLQLRLGIDYGVVGQEQSSIGLLSIGLLCVLMDDHFAVEHAVGSPIEDALVQFVARAPRLGVIDPRVMIDQLVSCRDIKPVQRGLAILRLHDHVQVGSSKFSAVADGVRRVLAAPALLNLDRGNVARFVAITLEAAMIERTAFSATTASVTALVKYTCRPARIVFDDCRPAALAADDERAALPGIWAVVVPRRYEKVNVDRFSDDRVRRNIDKRAIPTNAVFKAVKK